MCIIYKQSDNSNEMYFKSINLSTKFIVKDVYMKESSCRDTHNFVVDKL